MLGEELGRRVRAATDAALGGGDRLGAYRLPRPEGLHATLFYLGPAARSTIDAVVLGLTRALAGLSAGRLRLGACGAFPGPGRERVLWVGVEEGQPGVLGRLRAATLDGFAAAGVRGPVEEERRRPFRPHVTVARPRGRPRVPAAFHGLDFGLDWSPTEAALVESVRDAGGGPARYLPLVRFPLAPARGDARSR